MWQGRFASFIMDEKYLLACTKYIELNPVRAGIVDSPEKWKWSSANAHLLEKDDILVSALPLLEIVDEPWEKFLETDVDENSIDFFRKHERTGRPAGNDLFIENLEKSLKRKLKPEKPGPKKKSDN